MLIILEGPDGGGKSTLAELFRDRHRGRPLQPGHGWAYRSQLGGRTMTHDQMRTNTYGLVNDLRNEVFTNQRVLVERLHAVSDEVYRELFGGPRFLTHFETSQVMSSLAGSGVVVVYCRPPLQTVIDQGLKKAGDDTEDWLLKVGHRLPALYEAYDCIMNRLAFLYRIPVVRYDYTQASTRIQVEEMVCAG